MEEPIKYRTVWLSDIHLGTKGCQSEKLLSFLKSMECEYLILVGDIIDFWSLKRSTYWNQDHNTIIQKILRKSRHGTNVIFIPGNHDESLREYYDVEFGNIIIKEDYIHQLINNKNVYCVHGDIFDIVTRYHSWIAKLGDIGYNFLLWVNRHLNKVRAFFDLGYWSLSLYIKHKVKEAVSFISDYEDNVIKMASDKHVDGVICGHIHSPELEISNNFLYGNCGDWVENCTGIVEHTDGTLELFRWDNNTFISLGKL